MEPLVALDVWTPRFPHCDSPWAFVPATPLPARYLPSEYPNVDTSSGLGWKPVSYEKLPLAVPEQPTVPALTARS